MQFWKEKYNFKNIPQHKLLEEVKDKIVFDEETGFAYGFGFDEYIEGVKSTKTAKGGNFEEEIQSISRGLGLYTKEELIFLHRYIIALATESNYRERAKLHIMDCILLEVLESKKGRSNHGLKKLLERGDWDKLMVLDTNNLEALSKKIQGLKLKEESVQTLSLHLAKEQIKRNLQLQAKCSLLLTQPRRRGSTKYLTST